MSELPFAFPSEEEYQDDFVLEGATLVAVINPVVRWLPSNSSQEHLRYRYSGENKDAEYWETAVRYITDIDHPVSNFYFRRYSSFPEAYEEARRIINEDKTVALLRGESFPH